MRHTPGSKSLRRRLCPQNCLRRNKCILWPASSRQARFIVKRIENENCPLASRRFPAFIVRLRSPRSGGGLASPASNTPTPPIVKEEVPTLQANAPPADEPASEEPTAAVEPSNPPAAANPLPAGALSIVSLGDSLTQGDGDIQG